MQWSFILYVSSDVIEIKILLKDQILDHFMCHPVLPMYGFCLSNCPYMMMMMILDYFCLFPAYKITVLRTLHLENL
jgi:hypothetical protein